MLLVPQMLRQLGFQHPFQERLRQPFSNPCSPKRSSGFWQSFSSSSSHSFLVQGGDVGQFQSLLEVAQP